jgi:hypothetical protein
VLATVKLRAVGRGFVRMVDRGCAPAGLLVTRNPGRCEAAW